MDPETASLIKDLHKAKAHDSIARVIKEEEWSINSLRELTPLELVHIMGLGIEPATHLCAIISGTKAPSTLEEGSDID